MEWQISNASLVYGDQVEKAKGLHIKNGRILKHLNISEVNPNLANLNLNGLFVFPSFINSHDNLLASYHVFQGDHHPYKNWLAWDNALKASEIFRQRMFLEPAELYQLGSYRNILSGVGLVVDHIPHHVRRPFQDQLLVRLLTDFGISHSLCSYALKWGQGVRPEYEYAKEHDLPYIIHIAEGFDEESQRALLRLKQAGALGSHTVLVHGLSLSLRDLDLIAEAEAHLVWCPVSTWHIYQKMAPIQEAIERGINICLGSDAAMYGSENLMHDIRLAPEYYQKKYQEKLNPRLLLQMLTINPQKAFRLPDYGFFKSASSADLVILKGKYPQDPFASLQEICLEDIYLLVLQGEPVYGHADLESIFMSCGVIFERFEMKGKKQIIKKHPGSQLQSMLILQERLKGQNSLAFMPIMGGQSSLQKSFGGDE